MTISTTYYVSYTRDDIITAALGTIGVLAKGQTPDTEDLNKAAVKLNMLIGSLRTKGLFLWKRKEYAITPVANTKEYLIGTGQSLNTAYPLKLLDAFSTYISGFQNVPIDIISEIEYNILPSGATSGQPLKLLYQPKINYGSIKIWPTPDATVASNYTFTIVYQEPMLYPVLGTDTMEFPEEWYLPLVYGLASLIATDWGIPLEDRRALLAESKMYTDAAESFGTEDASISFYPIKR